MSYTLYRKPITKRVSKMKITCLVCGKKFDTKGKSILLSIKEHEKNNCKKAKK